MKAFHRLVYLIGAYKIGIPLSEFTLHYYNMFHREELESKTVYQRLRESYKGDWAVVTGASEGIGRAYALDLAKAGFNVMIASRSQSKLDLVKEQINQSYPAVQVKTVAIDLAAEKGYPAISKDKQVMSRLGVFINNAG